MLRRVEEQRGVPLPVGQRRVDAQHEQHVVEDVDARRGDLVMNSPTVISDQVVKM